MAGSKVRIYKQDPSVTAIGTRAVFLPEAVAAGPRDAVIQVVGLEPVAPDENGDFLLDPEESPEAFDAVHCFTVVRQVRTMYERALRRRSVSTDFHWQWGAGASLKVYPRAGTDKNAYYKRELKTLEFYSFESSFLEGSPTIYTCRSFDIVAHETGHAVLDALRPGYWPTESWHPQTRALHESFGDLTAIFTMLAQLDQCEAIVAESKGNLHEKTFFSAVGEQFGAAGFNRQHGLRNASEDFKLSEVSGSGPHKLSQVLTGAVYDILADFFADHRDDARYDPAESLYRVGRHLAELFLVAITSAPEKNATFADVARQMFLLETEAPRKEMIRRNFESREIGIEPEAPAAGAELGFAAEAVDDDCCATLRAA